MAATEAGGGTFPSPAHEHLCAEPGCEALRWTNKRRSKETIVSAYCFEHSHIPMCDPAPDPAPKPAGRRNPDAVFRKEVARRRRGDERR
jgi:hypothetical protein